MTPLTSFSVTGDNRRRIYSREVIGNVKVNSQEYKVQNPLWLQSDWRGCHVLKPDITMNVYQHWKSTIRRVLEVFNWINSNLKRRGIYIVQSEFSKRVQRWRSEIFYVPPFWYSLEKRGLFPNVYTLSNFVLKFSTPRHPSVTPKKVRTGTGVTTSHSTPWFIHVSRRYFLTRFRWRRRWYGKVLGRDIKSLYSGLPWKPLSTFLSLKLNWITLWLVEGLGTDRRSVPTRRVEGQKSVRGKD